MKWSNLPSSNGNISLFLLALLCAQFMEVKYGLKLWHSHMFLLVNITNQSNFLSLKLITQLKNTTKNLYSEAQSS